MAADRSSHNHDSGHPHALMCRLRASGRAKPSSLVPSTSASRQSHGQSGTSADFTIAPLNKLISGFAPATDLELPDHTNGTYEGEASVEDLKKLPIVDDAGVTDEQAFAQGSR
jgi:hypothetical protein